MTSPTSDLIFPKGRRMTVHKNVDVWVGDVKVRTMSMHQGNEPSTCFLRVSDPTPEDTVWYNVHAASSPPYQVLVTMAYEGIKYVYNLLDLEWTATECQIRMSWCNVQIEAFDTKETDRIDLDLELSQ